jgi:hypothetical protein
MAKFTSQKAIYDGIYERERKQKEVEEHTRKLREANQLKIDHALQHQRNLFNSHKLSQEAIDKQYKQFEDVLENPLKYATQQHYSHPENHSNMLEVHHEIVQSLQKEPSSSGNGKKPLKSTFAADPSFVSSIKALEQSTKASLHLTEQELLSKAHLTDFKVSSLQQSHPSLLKHVRNERALQYVRKIEANGLNQPPIPRQGPETIKAAFFPGGVAKPRQAKALWDKKPSQEQARRKKTPPANGTTIDIPIETLKATLQETEEQIARQRLKIGLQGGRVARGYEMRKASSKLS